jgi:hypothetical protein
MVVDFLGLQWCIFDEYCIIQKETEVYSHNLRLLFIPNYAVVTSWNKYMAYLRLKSDLWLNTSRCKFQ